MNYIVDTNVLLEYPNFLKESGRRFVLTYSVIRELDSKKTVPGTLGYNSRMVMRYIDELRKLGDISNDGVETPHGSWLIIVMDSEDIHTDDSIIQLGVELKDKSLPCTILSNDVAVRVKASANGVQAEGFGHDVKTEVQHRTIPEYTVPDRLVTAAFAAGKLDGTSCPEVPLNSYALFRSDARQNSTVVVFNNGIDLVVVGNKKNEMFGIKPKNLDQTCAFDALQRHEIPLVVLTGPAGSGKSLIAIAAAMDALTKKAVDKVLFVRSPIPVGKDIGFMPGDSKEKMSVWAGPLMDNLEVLMKGNAKNLEMYFERGMIEVAPLTFLRGRSLNRTFVILDEGQGLSDHEMKTVATRIGEGSRLVITGDLQQIDNPRVSSTENGLSTITEAFRGTKWAVALDLVKGERSDFSAAAATLL